MKKNFLGNEDAYDQLNNYLNMSQPGPLILSGKKGLGKKEAAVEVACTLLNCSRDNLFHSSDFYVLDQGKEGIKVEDILQLLEKSSFAALGSRKVYLICHAEKMNLQAQNKLLKLLEDKNGTNIVIMLCEQDTLLETIKSRCLTVDFLPLSWEDTSFCLTGMGIQGDDAALAAFICGNCPYCMEEILVLFPSLRDTYLAMKSVSDRKELLGVLHLIREKDTEEFYTVHSSHYAEALSMFQFLFYGVLLYKTVPGTDISRSTTGVSYGAFENLYTVSELVHICTEISKHQKQWISTAYTKNDFFDLIRYIIQISIK